MVKFLDAVEKDVEFYEVVNWRMRLKEIQERRQKAMEDRENSIKRARMLERGWTMSSECEKFLIEVVSSKRTQRRKRGENVKERLLKVQKSKDKKNEYLEKQKIKNKNRNIEDMLQKLLNVKNRTRSERVAHMKMNLWRR